MGVRLWLSLWSLVLATIGRGTSWRGCPTATVQWGLPTLLLLLPLGVALVTDPVYSLLLRYYRIRILHFPLRGPLVGSGFLVSLQVPVQSALRSLQSSHTTCLLLFAPVPLV